MKKTLITILFLTPILVISQNSYNLTLVANDNDIITQIPSTKYVHPNVVYKKFYMDYGNITKNHSINNYNNAHVLNSLNKVNIRNIS